jgi:hypothetical protein
MLCYAISVLPYVISVTWYYNCLVGVAVVGIQHVTRTILLHLLVLRDVTWCCVVLCGVMWCYVVLRGVTMGY